MSFFFDAPFSNPPTTIVHYLGNQVKTASYLPPPTPYTPTPEASEGPGPASLSSLLSLPPQCPLPCSHASQRTLPLLAPSLCSSGTRLLACPSPHSCLVNSSSWLQALGQRLLTHKVPWAQAGGLPVPFTHCTLPPPETRRPVLSHQQTCQVLSGCQALAWAPSHSSSKQPLSASPWPLQPLCPPLLTPPWLPLLCPH